MNAPPSPMLRCRWTVRRAGCRWPVWAVLVVLVRPLAAGQAELDALWSKVQTESKASRFEGARTVATELLQQAEREGNQVYTALAHYALGELAVARRDLPDALTHYTALSKLAEQLGDRAGAAYAAMAVGGVLRELRRFAESLPPLRRALELYTGQDNGMAGHVAVLAGESLVRVHQRADSLVMLKRAIELLRTAGRHTELCDAWLLLGQVQQNEGQTAVGEASLLEGVRVAREHRLDEHLAKGLGYLGGGAAAVGDYARAEPLLVEAAAICRRLGNPASLMVCLVTLGQVQAGLGRLEQALATYAETADWCRGHGVLETLNMALCARAVLLTERGRNAEALKDLDEASAVCRRMGDEVQAAVVQCNVANVKLNTGDLQGALATYLAAAPLFERAGAKEFLATLYNNIGRLYDMQSDPSQAVLYFRKCVELAAAIDRPLLAAMALNNAALVLYNLARPYTPLAEQRPEVAQAARERLTQARAFMQQAAQVFERAGDKRTLPIILNNLGQLASELGELDTADEFLTRGVRLSQELGLRTAVCQTSLNLGLLAMRRTRWADGRRWLEQSVAVSEETGELEARGTALVNLAAIDRRDGDVNRAIQRLYQSVEVVEQRRARVAGGSGGQLQFLASNIQPYQLLITALTAAGRAEEAFAVSERSRGRALLAMMDGGHVDLRQRLPESGRRVLGEAEARLTAANLRLSELAAAAKSTREELAKARAEVDDARTELYRQEAWLAGLYPDVALGRRGREPLDLKQAAAALPADTALLQYAFSTNNAFCFAVTQADGRAAVTAHEVRTGEGNLAVAVTRFREACANPRRRYRAEAAALYDTLLRPVLAALPAGIRRLVIVPDGPLFDCPFQVLRREPEGRYVLDDYELVVMASASLVNSALTLGDERRAAAGQRTALVIADPDFGARAVAAADEDERGGEPSFRLTPLPGTRQEGQRIREILGAGQVRLLTGKEAQERLVKHELPNYRYLHFATHGLLDPDQPLYSSIALAEPDQPGDDGFLEARELTRYSLKAELVTLSACQTGRGRTANGEGLIGLPWSFFVARVPTQVVSQWSVDDSMTNQLMTRFYQRLAKGEAKGAALRAAALELRAAVIKGPDGNEVNVSHPFYWAPFQLMGDWR